MTVKVFEDTEKELAGEHLFAADIKVVKCRYQFDLKSASHLSYLKRIKPLALLTGGAGFVGRHFAKQLCEDFIVIVVDDLSSESSMHPDDWPSHLKCRYIRFYQEDCRSFLSVKRKFYKDVKLFVHLAAVVGGRSKIEGDPGGILLSDLSIDISAFQWAVLYRPSHMVYFSSSAAYPVQFQQEDRFAQSLHEDLLSWDNNLNNNNIGIPDLTYGWTKLNGERMAAAVQSAYNLSVSVYRPFSGYGEDQHDAYPFKSILKKTMELHGVPHNNESIRDRIQIWSNSTRDFVYIDDIVECVIKTYDKNITSAINLATGIPTSMHELAYTMADLTGLLSKPNNAGSIHVDVMDSAPKGVHYRVGSAKFAGEVGCVFPTSLRQGIFRSIDFLQSNEALLDDPIQPTARDELFLLSDDDIQSNDVYSSHQCIGGSQHIPESDLIQQQHQKFPKSVDSQIRVCHFRNVCLNEGKLLYFQKPILRSLPNEFHDLNKFIALGTVRDLGTADVAAKDTRYLEVELVSNFSFPKHAHPHKLGLLDDVSLSYNIGHYLIENVIPHFAAANIFNLDISDGVQVFQNPCHYFGLNNPTEQGFPTVVMNGTVLDGDIHDICLATITSLYPYFFNHKPLFSEQENMLCFDSAVAGQSSAYGLRSLDLSRAVIIRNARDYIVDRNNIFNFKRDDSKLNIFVAVKGEHISDGF